MLVSGRLRESILTRHADILQSRGIAINQSHPLILAPAPATGHLPAAEVNRFTGNVSLKPLFPSPEAPNTEIHTSGLDLCILILHSTNASHLLRRNL